MEKIKKELPSVKLVRLVHISKDGKIKTDIKNIKYVDYYILDSFNLETNQVGGTGLKFDWEQGKKIIQKMNRPTFLAGGLTPENVEEAIMIINPYGVDVNSGCKTNGIKDRNKVIKFVNNAKM